MTDIITTPQDAPEYASPTEEFFATVAVGDTVTVTKDHLTRTMTVLGVDSEGDYGPYVLARDVAGDIVGFDPMSVRYGIVELGL
jgi:hypothetical protein